MSKNMSIDWADEFRDIQDLYNDTMEEVRYELNSILSEPESECNETDSPEYIESAIAENHNKMLAAVIGKAMDIMGKQIADTVSAYDNDDNYSSRTDHKKKEQPCTSPVVKDTPQKDYERYLEQDEKTWGEFFHNMNMYWKGVMADVKGDIDETLSYINEATEDLTDCTDDPEMMKMAVTAGRIRNLARVSENVMGSIGKCLGAVSSLFGKN